MLDSLELHNYRGFREHTVTFHQQTLLVGPNNAGKSTVIEALRLVSLVTNRPGLVPQPIPHWLGDMAAAPTGYAPSATGSGLRLGRDTFHRYADPPARIRAKFTTGSQVEVFVGPDSSLFAVIRGRNGALVSSQAARRDAQIPRVAVQPQVGPVRRQEEVRDPAYVLRAMDGPLAPSHFHNQLLVVEDHWETFKDLAESSWPELQLSRPEVFDDEHDEKKTPIRRVGMLVRDGAFTGELSAMGHGLQMWLQMLWFLARNPSAGAVVLDEPDVYMHPDLQRRLIRRLMQDRRSSQVIVATHSVEMMAEVRPENVVVLDPRRLRSRTTSNLAQLQRAIGDLGGVHILQYSRLWSSKTCLLVEGDDLSILKPLHDRCVDSSQALDMRPHFDIGGWSGWPSAIGVARFIRGGDADISVYCLLDSDYHWPVQLEERRASAAQHHIQLHIWRRKELENYLIDPRVIQRVVSQRCRGVGPTHDDVQAALLENLDRLQLMTERGFLDAHPDPALARSTQAEEAERLVSDNWTTIDSKLEVAPGKALLTAMSRWSQEHFDTAFGVGALAHEIRRDEIPSEVRDVLKTIEAGGDLTG